MDLVPGYNGILRFKNFQNLVLLQNDKLALDCKATDLYDPSNLSHFKECEAIVLPFVDPSNTVQLVEVLKTLVWEDCTGAAMIAPIKTANKLISGLCYAAYPMTLSPNDMYVIKDRKTSWICKDNFVDGSGRGMTVCDHDYVRNTILPGESNCSGLAYKYYSLNIKPQLFLSIYTNPTMI